MGRPKKNKSAVPKTALEINEDGEIREVTEVGVKGLLPAQDWDIAEELEGNEALRDYQRESQPDF